MPALTAAAEVNGQTETEAETQRSAQRLAVKTVFGSIRQIEPTDRMDREDMREPKKDAREVREKVRIEIYSAPIEILLPLQRILGTVSEACFGAFPSSLE